MSQGNAKKRKKRNEIRVVSHPIIQKRILRNLDQMDNRTDMAGKHSVLRVLVCYPSKPKIRATDVADDGEHPVASVNFDSLRLITSDATKKILNLLSRNKLMHRIFDPSEDEDYIDQAKI
jgi:hypothetical protein